MKSVKVLVSLVLSAAYVHGQSSGPSATPGALSFSYQVNSTSLPAAAKVTVSLPASISTLPLSVSFSSTPQGWLTVTPASGYAPLTLSVTVNPTGMAPGNYVGTITVNTVPASSNPAVVSANLLISNPPSTIMLTSPSSNYSPPASGTNSPTLTFTYTTGSNSAQPVSSELDVASNGGIIPFTVTAANLASKTAVWLRVNTSNQLPTLQTSGVALSGSFVPIIVTLDLATLETLNPGSYGGTITVAATNSVNGTAVVAVNLVVSAGPPILNSIFPSSVIAAPIVNPIITIYGDNFFSTSVVTLQQGSNPPVTMSSTLLSRQVLQATVNSGYLSSPGIWTLAVTNPAPPNNPSQAPVTTLFTVSDPTIPLITSVVNAASYLSTSVWTGTGGPNPVAGGITSVSPREIISIFGQNLGATSISTATPSGSPQAFPIVLNGIQVAFLIGNSTPIYAPIIMTSSNQINAVVPVEIAVVIGTNNPTVSVQVINTNPTPAAATQPFNLMVIQEDPGTFTFGGLGQGQAAVLNYDSTTGNYSINSAKNPAAAGSTILIYATGMGDLAVPVADGVVASVAGTLADATTRVDIAGQPAVVSYSGASPGAVAGLVQVNAIIPPTVAAGTAVSITVSIGAAANSRRSQPGVTISVK
jgi:uncharacterized protein (TIGR03437 family)